MNFKKIYKSNQAFKAKTKLLFLTAIEEKFGRTESRPSLAFRYFVRGTASGIAFMIILSGAATYADQKNVGPDNLFYLLKRSHEAVKSVFTSKENEASLHLEFAERRLGEIETLRSANPTSPKVKSLVTDFKKEVEDSFPVIENEPEPEVPQKTISAPTAVFATSVPSLNNSERSEGISKGETPPKIEERKHSGEKDSDQALPLPQRFGKIPPTPKDLQFCESWKKILDNRDQAVAEALGETPHLMERFSKRCPNSIEALPLPEIDLELKD